MAVGDGVDRHFRYEFRSWVGGSGTPFVVQKVEGLIGLPSARTSDEERQEDHGDHAGVDLIPGRTITMELTVAKDAATIQAELDTMTKALQVSRRAAFVEYPFVTWRPGHNKRFVNARARRNEFPSDFATARGKSKGAAQWYATDPLWYDLAGSQLNLTILQATTQIQGIAAMAGDFEDGVSPIIEIDGPATNPRIQSTTDGNRTIRIDVVVPAGQTLVIDTKRKTVFLNGVDRYDTVRADNQWWVLLPGNNTIVYSRTDNGVASNARVKWNNGWTSA